MLCQQLVDEGLIAQAPPLGFLPYGPENVGIDPNGNQASGRSPQGRASNPAHRAELRGRCRRNVGEVNPAAPCRPPALSGSPGPGGEIVAPSRSDADLDRRGLVGRRTRLLPPRTVLRAWFG